jgi:hypothetical protein
LGVLGALIFNACLVVLAVASAIAVMVIGRDHLYAYEYSDAGARAIATRVERLNSELIQLDFDRFRQWDDLIAMELMSGDISAARGFLLSGGHMLQSRYAGPISRAGARGDPAAELAALEILTPGTRARYESTVPLLSRRAQTVDAEDRAPGTSVPLGDEQDFELMARALIAEPSSDPLQFILTGFSLGLAGDFGPRANDGAIALVAASRRPDYSLEFRAEMSALLGEAMPIEAFRNAALASVDGPQAGDFDNAAAAFRASVNPLRATQTREALEQIGAMGEAISIPAAVDLITHATALRDLPRLRLVAQAAGDRAAAAAKRLPRDGRLLAAARGDLTVTRDLAFALAVAGLALAGLLVIVGFKAYQLGRRVWLRMQDEEYGAELVDMGGGASNWRPL